MTRRPVLPGAAELFRRTDAAAPPPAPVTELPTLAAAQSSPALRTSTPAPAPATEQPPAEPAPEPTPLALVPAARPVDDLAAFRGAVPAAAPAGTVQPRPNSGRTKHDEKITVYCSADELLALESARLQLRGRFGIAADRGRIVREAVAVLLADLEATGEESVLVRRLRRG